MGTAQSPPRSKEPQAERSCPESAQPPSAQDITDAMNWSPLHTQTAAQMQMDTSWLPHFRLEGNKSNLDIL